MNEFFKKIETDKEISEFATVIRESFKTVASEIGLTRENAPSHPSFITPEKLSQSIDNGLELHGLYAENYPAGCIGIEKSPENYRYYIERLAVLPVYRHRGYGERLLKKAFSMILEKEGRVISIAVINSQSILKEWYKGHGFRELRTQTFPHLPFEVCFMEKEL